MESGLKTQILQGLQQPATWKQQLPIWGMLLFWWWGSCTYMLHDFSNAYLSAVVLWETGMRPEIYDALWFNEQAVKLGYEGLFLAYYPNTPFLAFSSLPLLGANPFMAKAIFNLLSILSIVWLLCYCQRILQVPTWAYLLLPLVAWTAFHNNLYFGQFYLLLLAALVKTYDYFKRSQWWQGGLLWSWALLLKVFPVLLIFWALFRRQYQALLALGLASVAWILLSRFWIDFSLWEYYIKAVFSNSSAGLYYDGFTPAAKSALMLSRRLFLFDPVYNPNPFYAAPWAYWLVQTIYKTTILYSLWRFAQHNRTKTTINKASSLGLMQWSYWLLGCMLLAPGWSSYAAILLMLPLLVIWSGTYTAWQKFFFGSLVALYANLPMSYFYNLPLPFNFPKVGLLLTIAIYYYQLNPPPKSKRMHTWMVYTGFGLLFLGLGYKKTLFKPHPKNYALSTELPILLKDYAYHPSSQQLEYQYWNIPSIGIDSLAFEATIWDATAVQIQDQQLYYKGEQLTFDASRKRQAVLVDGRYVLYLSDQGRGMGFYTLLKTALPAHLHPKSN